MKGINWNEIFATAHLHSWPSASLTISNRQPPNGRNIYQEDKKEILVAASSHGYKKVSPDDARAVSFVNPTLKGQSE